MTVGTFHWFYQGCSFFVATSTNLWRHKYGSNHKNKDIFYHRAVYLTWACRHDHSDGKPQRTQTAFTAGDKAPPPWDGRRECFSFFFVFFPASDVKSCHSTAASHRMYPHGRTPSGGEQWGALFRTPMERPLSQSYKGTLDRGWGVLCVADIWSHLRQIESNALLV